MEEKVSTSGEATSSNKNSTAVYDLLIIGAGPSGLAVAERVAASGLKVCIVDPAPTSVWPNNYGVWIDEFKTMGLEDCLDVTWNEATVFLNSEEDGKKTLRRPYGRVNRKKLKSRLYEGCLKNNVHFKETLAKSVENYTPKSGGSVVMQSKSSGKWENLPLGLSGYSKIACGDGPELKGKLVLDATGHAKKFVQFRDDYDPGYQGAYGILVEVDKHPFDLDKMLFMDWRDDHLKDLPELRESNSKIPTFLYAMPFSETEIFFEETSLVARPIVPFDELKRRLDARLKYLGINIKSQSEEEYCVIPMGSSLPYVPQRVLGIGGTAGMVHPSTGYMVSRMLGAAPGLADTIIDVLGGGQPKIASVPSMPAEAGNPAGASSSQDTVFEETGNTATDISAEIWDTIWPAERLSQREFKNFGMEVLLTLDLRSTREFFSAFFSLSDYFWQGFLSSRLSLPELIVFGLSLFSKSSWEMRFSLVAKGLPGLIGMLTAIAKGPDSKYKK